MNPGEGSSTMFCAECSRPVDPRTGHCPACGVWSLDDTPTSHAFQGATPPFQAATPPPGMPWAPPQQSSHATPPPVFDLPPTYASAAPPAPPTPSAPAASSTYWPPPRASERADLPAPPEEAFAPEPFIIPPPAADSAPAPVPPASPAFNFPPSFGSSFEAKASEARAFDTSAFDGTGFEASAFTSSAFDGSAFEATAFDAIADPSLDDIDATMIAPRRGKTKYWTIDLPDGSTEVVNGSVIVGRLATPVAGRTGARLLSIEDPARSVSKNHAIFTDENGFLFVEDLDSMNGIVVTRSDGHVTDLVPGKRLRLDHGSTVELGDVLLTTHRN